MFEQGSVARSEKAELAPLAARGRNSTFFPGPEKRNHFTMETCHWASEGHDEKQEPIWIEAARLATPRRHPFYERLNGLLSKRGFDRVRRIGM